MIGIARKEILPEDAQFGFDRIEKGQRVELVSRDGDMVEVRVLEGDLEEFVVTVPQKDIRWESPFEEEVITDPNADFERDDPDDGEDDDE